MIAVLCVTPGGALALDPERSFRQYAARTWQIEDGLPQNSVLDIEQTADGFVWLGTYEGLVRFDGVAFEVHDRHDTPAMRSHVCRALHEDREGTLWVGTDGGGVLRVVDGEVTRWEPSPPLPSEQIYDIAEGADGTLWFGTGAGVVSLANGRVRVHTAADGLCSERVRSLCAGRDGTLWISGVEGGVCRLRDEAFRAFGTADGLTAEWVLELYEDRAGTLWVGTLGGGLMRFRDGRFEAEGIPPALADDQVSAVFEDGDGNLWVGSFGGGLFRLHDGRWEETTTADGLSADKVWSFAEDREGNLWIGTSGGGVMRLRDGPFVPIGVEEGLSHDSARAILEDRAGTLWLASAGGGIDRLREGRLSSLRAADGLAHDAVYTLGQRADGSVWAGTEGGVSRIVGDEVTTLTTEHGLPGMRITALLEDTRGDLWIGTSGDGVARLRGEGMVVLDADDGLPNLHVNCLYEDPSGGIWVGTQGGGAAVIRGDPPRVEPAPVDLAGDRVLSFFEDRAGRLWIGTMLHGLVLVRDGTVTPFTTADGLADDAIFAVIEEPARGDLYLTSNKGIFRVPIEDLLARAEGRIERVRCRAYGTADGMRSPECNGGFQPPATRTRDGRLWFPTIRGVVALDPAALQPEPLAPPVYVTRVLVDYEEVPREGPVALSADADALELHYTAPSFADPGRVRFAFRLDGYDEQWTDAGTRRVAYYTNLPPGTYEFRVRATTPDGGVGELPAALSLRKQPYFHQTPWFFLALAVLVVAGGVGAYRVRLRRVQERQRQLEAFNVQLRAEVERQTRELTEALAEVQRAQKKMVRQARLAALGNLVAGVSHEIGNPLNAALGGAETLGPVLEDLQRRVERLEGQGVETAELRRKLARAQRAWRLVQDGHGRIQQIVDNLRSYLRWGDAPVEDFDIEGGLRSSVALFAKRIDTQGVEVALVIEPLPTIRCRAGELVQVFTNLLLNALDAMPGGGRLEIRAERAGDHIEITFVDSGSGVPDALTSSIFDPFVTTKEPTEGTGLGLYLSHEIVRRHGGELTLLDGAGGAAFLIRLPWTLAEEGPPP